MTQPARGRVEELEELVCNLRHDLRGAVTPAALIADRLRDHSDPAIQRAGTRITEVIGRILTTLNATCDVVPGYSSNKEASGYE